MNRKVPLRIRKLMKELKEGVALQSSNVDILLNLGNLCAMRMDLIFIS